MKTDTDNWVFFQKLEYLQLLILHYVTQPMVIFHGFHFISTKASTLIIRSYINIDSAHRAHISVIYLFIFLNSTGVFGSVFAGKLPEISYYFLPVKHISVEKISGSIENFSQVNFSELRILAHDKKEIRLQVQFFFM